jgi:hypothetical protein
MRLLRLHAFAEAIDNINIVETDLAALPDQAGTLSEEEVDRYVTLINATRRSFEGMGLASTVDQITRFDRDISGLVVDAAYTLELLRGLKHRLEDELRRCHCFMMTPERAKFWEAPQLFGPEVWERFPSSIFDIEEAGKCLACGRGTATVFHLMRVMEVGLKATAKALGVPYAPSWDAYLKKMRGQLDAKWEDKSPEWKAEEAFFREVHSYLHAVKLAWRNPTMHVANLYDDEQAREVWDATRAFMRHLATKLSEEKE